jgi:hypothetical protein
MFDEYINVPENANELLFKKLDDTMLLIIKLGTDQQEIIDHVENYIDKICPPEINLKRGDINESQ